MKILSPDKIYQIDQRTIEQEPIRSIDLMERASTSFVHSLLQDYPNIDTTHIFCGPGNNGGDGLAIARLLSEQNVTVHVYFVSITDNLTTDCIENRQRLTATKASLKYIEKEAHILDNELSGIIIDAIFGAGLNRPLTGLTAAVVEFINASGNEVVAVDIPSGVFANEQVVPPAIHANMVYTFQLPKLAFLLPENQPYIEKWKLLDIGLLASAIEQMETSHHYTTSLEASHYFEDRKRFSHKGSYGHALILAGSQGKAGAAILAARAVLRSGCGLLTMHLPYSLIAIMQESVPEAMCSIDIAETHLTSCPEIEKYNSIGIGPGIGTEASTLHFLEDLLQKSQDPLVIDADALNLLAEHPELLASLPSSTILTPHPGEFRRLVGDWSGDHEKLDMQISFSKCYDVIMVLKGAHTCISDPDGNLYFNSTGNNGMATAGSGDTLTGIITGLLAQGYPALIAAILGVYLHGSAGDLALESQNENSMIASDIIDHIGSAFKALDENAQDRI